MKKTTSESGQIQIARERIGETCLKLWWRDVIPQKAIKAALADMIKTLDGLIEERIRED